MVKLNFWTVSLFTFAIIFSSASLFFSIWVYSMDFDLQISTRFSSEADVGFFVESSDNFCGDSLCNGVETCSTCSGDCGVCAVSSSSGGGGGGVDMANFRVSEDEFNLRIVSGEQSINDVLVENIGSGQITINIEVTGIERYISFDTNKLSIAPGQSVPLVFTINAPEPGIYAGKIILNYQGITREVLIIMNVVSEGVLFDTIITLPELYRIIFPGQRLPALVEITEIGGKNGVDVTINYLIKDFDGKTQFLESETIYILGMKKFNKLFYTNGLGPGDYIVGVEVIYPGGFATSSTPFSISTKNLSKTWVALGILLMSIIFIILLILFLRRHDDEENSIKLKGAIR